MVNNTIHIAGICKEWGIGSIGGYRDHITATRSGAAPVAVQYGHQCKRYRTAACLDLRFRGLVGGLGLT